MNVGAKVKNINLFTVFLFITVVMGMGAVRFDLSYLRLGSYVAEVLLILYTYVNSKWNLTQKTAAFIIICAIIIVVNNIVSPYEHSYSDILKYFGYLCLFMYGKTIAQRYDAINVNTLLLYLLVLFPAIVVALLDNSVLKNSFFPTSNTFVYMGLAMGLFYMLINYHRHERLKIAWIIVALYILICTSLGVVVAIALAFVILNLKRSHLPYLILGTTVLLLAILYIDIPLFARFRDVLALWSTMSSDDLKNLSDVNYYELNQRVDTSGERQDIGSSVWRLSQWSGLLIEYFKKIWSIPFGLGTGFSVYKTGLLPHNDYVMILTEYGLIVFLLFVRFILSVYRTLKNEGVLIYFILPMFIYSLTENLIQSFPQNAIFYFVLGWCMIKFDKKRLQTT